MTRTAPLTMLLATLLVAATQPLPAQEPFTIQDVLSAPFPSGLVAAPSGQRVAWVRNHQGVRNIWVADAPDWRGRQVTHHEGDVGRELGGLEFTPDGTRLVYGVGGSPNRAGEFPNPASLPDGPEQASYVLDLATGERFSIPGGSSRSLAPDGSRIAFVRGNTVHTAPLRQDAEAEPLFEARGGLGSLTWSPDGSRLAFVSRRGDHAFIGVYDTAAHGITWMDPSVDHDTDPTWSPDGTRLAFRRTPNRRDALPFFAQPESLPWSVMVADPATGRSLRAWRADEGPGSAFRYVSGPSLIWAGDRLVFPWEKRGWTHLWSIPAPPLRAVTAGRDDAPAATAGGTATLLTPGEFEVQFVSLSADGDDILYSSNQGDIDRQHLWRVPVAGGTPRPVTRGSGIEWAPVEPRPGVVVFLASGARTPARAEALVDGQRRALDPDTPPASFPTEHLVEPEQVVFPADDGLRIHGQLFNPPAACGDGPHPSLLFFHGGSRRQMLLGFHHRGYYHNTYAFNQYMAAARCWVVLAVNYRSGIGYGLGFREAENYGAGGASELADVTGAARWLAARGDVDADRVALWGGSYGGYLTALGLARAPELFAAGVDLHGVHDWNVGIANFVDYDPVARPDVAESALRSSPMYDLDRWEDPVLIVHGDDDRNVRFSESVDLVEELRLRDVPIEQLVLPDEVHGFLRHESWLRVFRRAAEFLDREVR